MTVDPIVTSRRALLLGLVASVSAAACGGSSPTDPSPTAQTWVADVPFQTIDLEVGTGDEVVNGTKIRVDYVAWLYSTATSDNKGTIMDTSLQGRGPFEYVVGAGTVIAGWERGIPGMRVLGVRRLIVPPALAYGSTGNGSIPANATMIFEVRVNEIVS
ncbi:MAG: FKBP-type peptidyl-prolyl cis-trans isomerase [Acidobacteria bacterium]|nr:FKBP-type peptidyl-prolyl cis-trans isomerase [Acidobacteriota bacterium]